MYVEQAESYSLNNVSLIYSHCLDVGWSVIVRMFMSAFYYHPDFLLALMDMILIRD